MIKELELSANESKYYKAAHVKLRTDLNYLSFIIVGAVLALNKQIELEIYGYFGLAILLINALASYINVSRNYKTTYDNYDKFTSELNSKRSKMMESFNDLTRDYENAKEEKMNTRVTYLGH